MQEKINTLLAFFFLTFLKLESSFPRMCLFSSFFLLYFSFFSKIIFFIKDMKNIFIYY